MKYEIYFVRYASVIVEADSKEDALSTIEKMDDGEDTLDNMLDSESAWEIDYIEKIKEEK